MRKTLILLFIAFGAIACTELGRIDQVDTADYVPEQVTVTSIRQISGGAIIKFAFPDDIHLRGVRAEYDRNGEQVFTQVSKYVDSLKVEGFSDTQVHQIKLFSLGKNNKLSDPVTVDFSPGVPALKKIRMSLYETFGGLRLVMQGNEDNAALALTLLQDSNLEEFGMDPSQMKWEELYTYYTSGQDATLTRYGLDTLTRIYGVYARDRWMNYSDTVYFRLKPLKEDELPRSNWKQYHLPGDETQPLEGKYFFERFWDGAWNGNNYSAGFSVGARRKTFTIDMGYTASFSRMRMQPNNTGSNHIGLSYNPYHWQIWGSMDPNPNGEFDESWYLLGDVIQVKLSGLNPDGSMGTETAEDNEYFLYHNDYEFVSSETILNPQRETRFIRLVVLDNAASYFRVYEEEPNNIKYIIGELMFWGTLR